MTLAKIHAILTTQQAGNKTLLSSIRYGDISLFQADFCFAPSKLIIQTLIIDKCSTTISMFFCSSITILKHPSIYQNNQSQVLVIISVKITNKFKNFFWFCIAHDILNHSSAVILMYRFKCVTGNFRY